MKFHVALNHLVQFERLFENQLRSQARLRSKGPEHHHSSIALLSLRNKKGNVSGTKILSICCAMKKIKYGIAGVALRTTPAQRYIRYLHYITQLSTLAYKLYERSEEALSEVRF
ncbi:hypothetical protein PABG_11525 [Paracoccidioides brasiliensis Pb03]|nr:hypothetical protein PABG_11525 [Paracoccidioides brasiliensis Pb03]